MKIELKDSMDQVKRTYPMEQFVLNDKQQFCCIGGDFSEFDGIENVLVMDNPIIKAEPLGTLEDQGAIFQSQIINSLKLKDWDFEAWPNPEIVLLSVINP